MNKEELMPFILGSDENAYGMARSFHERYGIVSTALCAKKLVPTRYSKIIEVFQIDNFDQEEIFIKNLLSVAVEKKKKYKNLLLIPCSDRYTELVARFKVQIKQYFCNNFTSLSSLSLLSKDNLENLCCKYGFRYPKTIVCSKDERLAILQRQSLKFPIVVKANNSNSYNFLHSNFVGKKKMFFVKDFNEYTEIINNMNCSDYDDNIIIQEFIFGDDTFMRVINCYSDDNGKVKFMSVGQPVIEEYAPLSLGNFGAILTAQKDIACEKIKRLLEDVGYIGFSNFDIKIDSRTGEYNLIDINPRQGRSSYSVTASGYNLAELLVDNSINKKNNEIILADSDHLWLTVPKKILFDYVENKNIILRIKRLIKEQKYSYTLLYKADYTIKRYLLMIMYYSRHKKQYKKYFFKKIS